MDQRDESDAMERAAISRRELLGGLSLAAGALGLAGVASAGTASAAPAGTPGIIDGSVSAAALAAVIPGLVYLPLDAWAFDTATTASSPYRLYQELTGMQPSAPANYIYASLPIPAGSVIRQINVAYQGQPVVSICRRGFDAVVTDLTTPTSLAAGGGVKTQTLTVDAELTAAATYAIRAFCSAGDSIVGVSVGYVPAAQAFIPYTGATPRAYDSRDSTRFAVDEERVIDLSGHLIPTARAAVVNLTAAEPAGGGYLSAFADGIAWPGNSTTNYGVAGVSVANGAVVTMNQGKIKVRCNIAASHVVVDVVGSLL